MPKTDVTNLIERMEHIEERLGVKVDSLSAFLYDTEDEVYLTVCGEVLSREGKELKQSIELVIAAYDQKNRIVDKSNCYYDKEDFLGLEIFERTLILPVKKLSKVLVYLKKAE